MASRSSLFRWVSVASRRGASALRAAEINDPDYPQDSVMLQGESANGNVNIFNGLPVADRNSRQLRDWSVRLPGTNQVRHRSPLPDSSRFGADVGPEDS